MGEDAAGSVFPESPRLVVTWKLADYRPEQVIGVRSLEAGSFDVYVAESVSPEDRHRIYSGRR